MYGLVLSGTFSPVTVARADSASRVCVTDDLARQVCVIPFPQRIISLAPSLTEILFDLRAGGALVGRTARCNQPAEALGISDVGAYLNPDLERIMSLKPDLVVCPEIGMRKEVVTRLTGLGIPVFVDKSSSLDAMVRTITRLGSILGKEADAQAVADRLRQRRQAVAERVGHECRPVVLFAVGIRPLVAAGGKSFVGSLIREAGGANVAEDAAIPYPRLNMEEVIRHDPDFIIVLNKECRGQECFDQWQRHQELKAVRNKRVYQLDADLMARPCPRAIEALEQLAATIHPERFGTGLSTGGAGIK